MTTSPGLLTDTNFHHVAVTKSGSTVVFYVDGVAYPVAAYNPGFTFTTPAAIGALGELHHGFWGTVDELSVYNRALSTAEIAAIYNAGSTGKGGLAPSVHTVQTSPPLAESVTQDIRVEDKFALATARIRWQAEKGEMLPLLFEPTVLTRLDYPTNALKLVPGPGGLARRAAVARPEEAAPSTSRCNTSCR